VEADGSYRVFRTGIQVPNSLAWSPDGRTMYFADSPRHKIWAFTTTASAARFSGERVFATRIRDSRWLVRRRRRLPVERRWGAGRIVRYTPAGRIRSHRQVPAEKPSCCCFGGSQLDTLYITSADRAGLSPSRPA